MGAIGRLATESERRLHRVWLEDGLNELLGAAWALTVAVALIAARVFFLVWFALVLLLLVALPSVLGVYFRLKARIADPRVGYVRPRSWAYNRWLARLSPRAAMLFVVAVSILYSAIFQLIPNLLDIDLDPLFRWLWVALVVVLPVSIAWRTGLRRFYLYGVVPLVVELGARLAGLDHLLSLATYLAVIGVVALVCGGLALRAYLRSNPLPVTD